MKTLRDLSNLSGKRVLVRAAFNVPMEGDVIRDTARIDDALPTIEYLLDAGARVIVVSHHSDVHVSLKPVADYLESKGLHVSFVDTLKPYQPEDTPNSVPIVLYENLRRYPGETSNDPAFVQELASLADVYVNDDFTSAHRAHASIVGVPAVLPSVMGFAFEHDYGGLRPFLEPERPSLAVIGGAKPETKLPLIAAMADRFDVVYAAGVSANALFEDRGDEIGLSQSASKEIPNLDAITADTRIKLPVDVRIESAEGEIRVGSVASLVKNDRIIDAGPESLRDLVAYATSARFVLWNGPLGSYEAGNTESTFAFARALASSGADVVIGGGDTIASIKELGLLDSFAFVSDAGGAMLHLFAHGTLPAVEALEGSRG